MSEPIKRRGRPPKETAKPVEVAQPAAPDGTFACMVLRDFWPEEDVRIRTGTVIHVDAATAIDGIESGALSRVK